MYSIHDLCEETNLSRSTILYYHSIGLLEPISRTQANYRVYSEESLRRLKRICLYREAGVPLNEIGNILSAKDDIEKEILEKILSEEIKKFKLKQKTILSLLNKKNGISEAVKGQNRDLILDSLSLLNIDDDALIRLHTHLEKMDSEVHIAILTALGFSKTEIKNIREVAQESIEADKNSLLNRKENHSAKN